MSMDASRFDAAVRKAFQAARDGAADAIFEELDAIDEETDSLRDRAGFLQEELDGLGEEDGNDAGEREQLETTRTRLLAEINALEYVSHQLGRIIEDDYHLRDIILPGYLFGSPVTASVTERLCACGCGRPVTSPRPEARYAAGACRVRALRERREAVS